MKYGRVPEDVRPSSSQAFCRSKMDTAPGVIETLLSSQVFSFRSISMDNQASSSATLLESNATVIENRMLPKISPLLDSEMGNVVGAVSGLSSSDFELKP